MMTSFSQTMHGCSAMHSSHVLKMDYENACSPKSSQCHKVYLCFGKEELIEELGSILGTGNGMSDSPLVLVNLVIVSAHVGLSSQPCITIQRDGTCLVTEEMNLLEPFILDMVQRESLVPSYSSVLCSDKAGCRLTSGEDIETDLSTDRVCQV